MNPLITETEDWLLPSWKPVIGEFANLTELELVSFDI